MAPTMKIGVVSNTPRGLVGRQEQRNPESDRVPGPVAALQRRRENFLRGWGLSIAAGVLCGAIGGVESSTESSRDPYVQIDIRRDTGERVVSGELALFSEQWENEYRSGHHGCRVGMGSYTWRPYGFGSNMNNMLNAWVYALSVKKWEDIALVIDPHQLDHVACGDDSEGNKTVGWSCLFEPMPHLCTFDNDTMWMEHMGSRGVSEQIRVDATSLTLNAVRFAPEMIVESLDGSGVDHMGALAVVSNYLWSHLTPWIKTHIYEAINGDDVPENFPERKFVGVHIRRGDKVSEHEAERHEAEEYLSAAAEYLRATEGVTPVDEIEGIWVASDDPHVLAEVRNVSSQHFPNVEPDMIVCTSGDGGVATHTNRQGYESFVYMFADLRQLALAEVFVGTFSSNVGRLVAVLRDGIHKHRSSALSLDVSHWWPGRRQKRSRRTTSTGRSSTS